MGKFNLNEIRNLNRVQIFESTQGEPVQPVFEAYTTGGYDYSMNLEAGSMGGMKDIFKGNFWHVAAQAVLGYSGALDMDRRMFLKGAQPIGFSVNCFLLLDSDPYIDMIKPIEQLVKYAFPQRGQKVGTNLSKGIDTLKEKKIIGEGFYEVLKEVGNFIDENVGDMWWLKSPYQFRNQDGTTNLSIRLGNTQIDGVYIKGMKVKTPQFLIENSVGAPVPSRLEITLEMETLRGCTSDIINFNKFSKQ